MRVRTLCIAVVQAGLIARAAFAAVPTVPPAAVVAPIAHMLRDCSNHDSSHLDSYYLSNATVVDEFAPYTWTGSNAALQWWDDLERANEQQNTNGMKVVMLPVKHFAVSGDRAYVIVPLVITYTASGKPQTETGLAAFTLRRSGGAWKIATQSWATSTNTM